MANGLRLSTLALLVSAWVLPGAAWAQDSGGTTTRSGYELRDRLGGPDSVQSDLRYHDAKKDSLYRGHFLEDVLAPYYALKKDLNDNHGLSFGLDYNVLYQAATEGLTDDRAAGGVFRFYGKWILLGRGTPDTGSFVFRIENRHRLGTDIPPTKLGDAIGSLYDTAAGFSDWGWGVTNLQWQQRFSIGSGCLAFALGQVDLRDWVDVFDLSNWRSALDSQAVTFPTNPLPSAGLGGAVFAYLSEENTPFLIAGVGDANGHADQVGFDTFFNVREYYTFAGVGITPSIERRTHDHLQFTYWHQDARREEGTPEGWGLSFSAGWKFEDKWAPFLRGGYSEGGVSASKAALIAGMGIHYRSHDVLGFALGWGKPHEDDLRDQVTFETFYRLQISQNVGITPDVQLLINPSRNPDESMIAVFSIRVQLAF
jgi:porin